MANEATPTFDQWCVLELFGHVRLAGHVTEAQIGGSSFLRVDVPKPNGDEIYFTRYYGAGAVYSMTPCSEEIARIVGKGTADAPITPYELRKALPSPHAEDDDDNNNESSFDGTDF